jgi:hypothetical protein
MIRWYSNFQIPNSGTQTEWVYVKIINYEDNNLTLLYSGEENGNVFLKQETIDFYMSESNPSQSLIYDALLKTPEFSQFSYY